MEYTTTRGWCLCSLGCCLLSSFQAASCVVLGYSYVISVSQHLISWSHHTAQFLSLCIKELSLLQLIMRNTSAWVIHWTVFLVDWHSLPLTNYLVNSCALVSATSAGLCTKRAMRLQRAANFRGRHSCGNYILPNLLLAINWKYPGNWK